MTENDEPTPLTPEEETAVHDLLAALPDPPLPADVERRIVAAVATVPAAESAPVHEPPRAEPSRPVTPASHPSGRWRSPWLLQSAAVLVIVALVGAVVVGFVNARGGDDAANQPLALSQETAGPVTTSGRQYAGATLAGQVRGLIVGGSEGGAANDDSPVTASGEVDSAASAAQVAKVDALVQDPKARQACIDQLASVPGALPVAVDGGYYEGRPAAIFVLPDENDPAKVAAWVVGPTCSSADRPFPYRYERVTRP